MAAANVLLAMSAGICSAVVGNPFWVANTRIRLELPRKGTSVWGMLRFIWKKEGLRGWFAGIVPALVLVLNPAIQFFLYDLLKETLTTLKVQTTKRPTDHGERRRWNTAPGAGAILSTPRRSGTADESRFQEGLSPARRPPLSASEAFILGIVAKLCATLLTYPYLVVKTRAQTKLHNVHDNSASFRCLVTILETEGLRGLFAGLHSKLLATLASSAIMFSVYEKLLPHMEYSARRLCYSSPGVTKPNVINIESSRQTSGVASSANLQGS
ncbi:mitochondrial carrier superfamily protein [Cystoisospora suis]|uniref:Mitochondrial carrier superfamily protein n=1 Tax=Cystoisospora suis TaxID=483139 RepID=A0A2C6LA25_9APIC|nr:mitochondrial carrier superfamily protein [Cystoisospora suis]